MSQFSRQFHRYPLQLAIFGDLIDKSPGKGLLSTEHRIQKNQFLGPAKTDEASHHQRPGAVRNKPQIGIGLPESCGSSTQAQITGRHETQATAADGTVDRSDNRFRHGPDAEDTDIKNLD